MTDNIFIEKKKYSKMLKDFFKFKTKNKPTGLIIVKDEAEIDFLLDWLEILSCDFIIKTQKEIQEKLNVVKASSLNKDLLLWVDFIITDNESEWLNDFFTSWITPIVPKNNHLSWILKEFDPLSSEWNSFLYEDKNKWSMYYAIVRYLENYKFPYDNRNLVKNVVSL